MVVDLNISEITDPLLFFLMHSNLLALQGNRSEKRKDYPGSRGPLGENPLLRNISRVVGADRSSR